MVSCVWGVWGEERGGRVAGAVAGAVAGLLIYTGLAREGSNLN